MIKTSPGAALLRLPRSVRALAAVALTVVLAACGGGGVVPSTSVAAVDAIANQSRTQTPEWAEYVSRKAVAYSPFRSNDRDTETVTEAMVLEDLQLLEQGGFKLIRLFDSSDKVARLTLQLIRDHGLDIKMQLGAYILSESSPFISEAEREAHRVNNRAEVQRAIALAKEFEDIVLAVSIGNETMIYWSFVPSSPEIMAAYITQVRQQIKQPVTTNDNWFFWSTAPKIITDAVDFASLHTYCELDTVFDPNKPISTLWKQGQVHPSVRAAAMMDAMIACAKEDYQAARDWLDKKGQAVMPIVIGETGWNAVNVGALSFRAHPVNQKMYFQALQKWRADSVGGKGPANITYFEAFDEPWKGSDDKWGLFNVQRQARYVIQSLYPQNLWEPGNYSAADAAYWVPMSNDAVSAARYTLYAEDFTLNEARPATPTLWNAWENGTTASAAGITGTSPPDGSTSLQITPQPRVWGWGIAMNLKESNLNTDASADLSAFAAGTLNFSVRSTYRTQR
jgi:exo-beta-1,3-glucanase (GH17 family)